MKLDTNPPGVGMGGRHGWGLSTGMVEDVGALRGTFGSGVIFPN